MTKQFPRAFILPAVFFSLFYCSSASAEEFKLEGTIAWQRPCQIHISQCDIRRTVHFTGAQYQEMPPGLPWLPDVKPVHFNGKVSSVSWERPLNRIWLTNGFRSDLIVWNGLDDFGDLAVRGVYVYRLRLKTPEGKSAGKFEKLVVLN